ncbi:LOG family protein [bacterium]|nr:LOG family protein [bacterium]
MNLSVHKKFEVDNPFCLFGGGAWQPGSEGWKLSERIGRMIANRGFTLVTGGYGGAMEAASKGAIEAGGEAVGILYAPPKVHKPNPHIDKFFVASDYTERMSMLLRVPRAIGLPGGSGTLAEIWSSIALVRRFEGRKFAIWEPFWQSRLGPMLDEFESISAGTVEWVASAEDVGEWLNHINLAI